MYSHTQQTRVRYGETDQMGYCYYGNYAQFFELGRVENLRSLNMSYKDIEEEGFLLPVINLNINYIKPSFYDDLLTIKTTISKMPSVKIEFNYEIFNEKKELITKGQTTLVFLSKETMKPTKCPENLLQRLKPYF